MRSFSLSTAVALLAVLLSGCSSQQVKGQTPLDPQAVWVLMPLVNQSQTPFAGERVEAMLESMLRGRGVDRLRRYPATAGDELPAVNDLQRYQAALPWLQTQEAAYVVTGSVQEWRYKSGLDGEPAVGLTLAVRDRPGQVLWTGTGARAGWGRESLGRATLVVLEDLLKEMPLEPQP